MALIGCPGCKKKYENGSSLSAHQRKCVRLEATAKGLIKKRDKNRKRKESAKVLRPEYSQDDDNVLEMRAEVREHINSFDVEETSSGKRKLGGLNLQSDAPTEASRQKILKFRIPQRFQDEIPPAPPYIPAADNLEEEFGSPRPSEAFEKESLAAFRTESDSYGVFREYAHGKPTITPDHLYSISDSSYITLDPSLGSKARISSILGSAVENLKNKTTELFEPFRNVTIFRLMSWFYRPSLVKSIGEINTLVKEVILAPDFDPEHLVDFDAAKENKRMDEYKDDKSSDTPSPFSFDDSWIKGSIELSLPCEEFTFSSESKAPKFRVEVYHRKLVEVIQAALAEPAAEKFHTFPFKAYWKPSSDAPMERIYSEVYTGDAWHSEYEKIQETAQHGPNAHLEMFIIALLLWSDSTCLAQFGDAQLWPIYLYFGNQSKYDRSKPTSFASHHIAYIPKLDENIQEFYKTEFGKPASAQTLKQLRKDLFHAVWELLIDDDFVHAYVHGLVFKLFDRVSRVGFPRFFFYSMDYPEKVLAACIKYLGLCPCPRCLQLKSKIYLLGSKSEMRSQNDLLRTDSASRRTRIEKARKLIFEGVTVTSKKIERVLGSQCLVPTRNAFSVTLSEYGFDFYQMIVPDLLHEFELGVWKAVFTHLLRILYAYGNDTIQSLNERYRQIPTFGQDTIRRFTANASAMRKLGARDFEDLLQCAIPVFEGLLPKKHDRIVGKLLFELCTWHGLAKLRLHTETTVNNLEHSTTRLGKLLREFRKEVCSGYATKELPSEEAARIRRKAAAAKKLGQSAAPSIPDAPKSRQQRTFNLSTYKIHALGHYARAIRLFGTTDNFNSQTGELEHRRVKRFYKRVHKGKHVIGIGQQVRRERFIHRIQEQQFGATLDANSDAAESPSIPPTDHYHISSDKRQKTELRQWLKDNESDPALQDFIPRLKNHLLSRLLCLKYDGDELEFTPSDRSTVIIEGNTIFQHKVLRVNYTTYDMRREQDSVHPSVTGHGDIMVLSPENEDENNDPHPYWYARVLGIYHANVRHIGSKSKSHEPKQMEFLFVRWFGRDPEPRTGWKAKRLIRLGFVPGNDGSAFGFLDPSQVIRAVHLIPAFHWGRVTTKYLPRSPIARGIENPDEDWQLYYLGMFSDRDLLMRFRGGGVGHKSTRQATDFFKNDRDRLDKQTAKTEAEEDDNLDNEEEDPAGYASGTDNKDDDDDDEEEEEEDEYNQDTDSDDESEDETLDDDFGYAVL